MNQEEFDRLTQQSLENIRAKVICDSVNPDGCRLTTMEWKYPQFIHAEIIGVQILELYKTEDEFNSYKVENTYGPAGV